MKLILESRENQKEKVKKIEEKLQKNQNAPQILYEVQNEVPVVVAGTTEKLIEALADKTLSEQYLEQFMLTYRYHTNGEVVLTKLFQMYQNTEDNDQRNKYCCCTNCSNN